MSEHIQDAIDNLKAKFKNSIIITFVLVWCINHWELIYSVSSFDRREDLATSIYWIKSYFKGHNMFWLPLLYSLCSLTGFYAVLILTNMLYELYMRIQNNVLYWMKSKKVIQIEKFHALEKERDFLRTRTGEFQVKEINYISSKQELEKNVQDYLKIISLDKKTLQENEEKIKEFDSTKADNAKIKEELKIAKSNEAKNLEQRLGAESRGIILDSKIKKLKTEIENFEGFKVWCALNRNNINFEWETLADNEKLNFIDQAGKFKKFKLIFGTDKWSKVTKISEMTLSEETWQLTYGEIPVFIDQNNKHFQVVKLDFIDGNNIKFSLKDNENFTYRFVIDTSEPNRYTGMQDGKGIEFVSKSMDL